MVRAPSRRPAYRRPPELRRRHVRRGLRVRRAARRSHLRRGRFQRRDPLGRTVQLSWLPFSIEFLPI